ncbi:MAG: ribonuclease P protein component [Clostridiales bacterium]|jgi:ribonuclease P protein component|nr:ribonuclease P protein component [Clostridiales bacterium]
MRKPDVLRNKKDFSSIYNNGKSIGGKYLVVFYKKNGLLFNRRAFLASKKVGGSVQRNRARRLLRESYRHLEDDIKKGYDLIFIARKSILKLKCADVKESMEAALKKANIFEKTIR